MHAGRSTAADFANGLRESALAYARSGELVYRRLPSQYSYGQDLKGAKINADTIILNRQIARINLHA